MGMYGGYVELARNWLKMELAAKKALQGPRDQMRQEPAFYEAKIQTSQFVFDNILPRTRSLSQTMFTPFESVMKMPPKNFSFDYAEHRMDEEEKLASLSK